jgi:Family of unknown function (DUF6477)
MLMQDPTTLLNSLRRPHMLIRAARLAMVDYRRNASLRRLLPGEPTPGPGHALQPLAEAEEMLDQLRREGGAAYSVGRHIELLAALIVEARLARRPAA